MEIRIREESNMNRVFIIVAGILIPALTVTAQAPRQGKAAPAGYGQMEWVDPDRTPAEATAYKTFESRTIHAPVSYLVYLPPDYEQQRTARYPVLYELPASGQSPKGGAEIVRRVDQGIRAGRIAPMIIILVNGLRGNTMYCDSRDGKYPLETVIVKDLIPHVDATYRTTASREARALDGFSMGGFGAAHLGFKYPEMFGVLSIMAPPLLGPELKWARPAMAWSRLFPAPAAMGGDLEYFRANDPFTLAEKNAAALRDSTVIRIVAHLEEEGWLWPQCEKLHKLLVAHMIQHEFYFLTNVKGHNRVQCLNTMGDGALALFSSSLVSQRRP
jgi:enterochelin esterase-like enzyme